MAETKTGSADSQFADIAVTGSPNSVSEIRFDVRQGHQNEPLQGTLLSLDMSIEGLAGREDLVVMGQVASVETRNRWHEDPVFKNYVKLKGRLPHLTEVGDVTEGVLQVVGAYRKVDKDGVQSLLKTRIAVPPGSGIRIDKVNPDLVEWIMSSEHAYGYLGKFYGSERTLFPVLVRHFGDKLSDGTGGSGESYMGCVFGPSGSGKSIKAAELIVLWAQHPEMGILILDPAGEFAENTFGGKTGFDFDFHGMMHAVAGPRFDPSKNAVGLDMLQLEGNEIFVEILKERGFFRLLGGKMKVEDYEDDIVRFLDDMEREKKWDPGCTWEETNDVMVEVPSVHQQGKGGKGKPKKEHVPFGDFFTGIMSKAYASGSRDGKFRDFSSNWVSEGTELARVWESTARFFRKVDAAGSRRVGIYDALRGVALNGEIWIFNLNPKDSSEKVSQQLKLYIMHLVFKRLRQVSHVNSNTDREANCLVVMDEAGRFVPQTVRDDDRDTRKDLCNDLVDSTKELRKFRVGFMFITQGIAEIHKEIYRNSHYRVYGVGLGVGADADHIRNKEGNEAFDLYRTLPEPRLSGAFSFMVSGILLALGSSGKPMVIEGFSGGPGFLSANTHIVHGPVVPLRIG